jgi:hypothetical protein
MVLLAAVWGCSLREYVMQEPKYTWGRIQGLLPEDVILEMSDVYRERSYDPTFFWIRLVRHDSLFIGKLDWMSAQVYEVDTTSGPSMYWTSISEKYMGTGAKLMAGALSQLAATIQQPGSVTTDYYMFTAAKCFRGDTSHAAHVSFNSREETYGISGKPTATSQTKFSEVFIWQNRKYETVRSSGDYKRSFAPGTGRKRRYYLLNDTTCLSIQPVVEGLAHVVTFTVYHLLSQQSYGAHMSGYQSHVDAGVTSDARHLVTLVGSPGAYFVKSYGLDSLVARVEFTASSSK